MSYLPFGIPQASFLKHQWPILMQFSMALSRSAICSGASQQLHPSQLPLSGHQKTLCHFHGALFTLSIEDIPGAAWSHEGIAESLASSTYEHAMPQLVLLERVSELNSITCQTLSADSHHTLDLNRQHLKRMEMPHYISLICCNRNACWQICDSFRIKHRGDYPKERALMSANIMGSSAFAGIIAHMLDHSITLIVRFLRNMPTYLPLCVTIPIPHAIQ